MRLVSIGDSFTEGLCDDLRPDGQYRGWADRVAGALAPVEYANLAVRGKLLDQIVAEQVPVAAAMAPDVVTFHAGGNDVLRRSTDLDDLFARRPAAMLDAFLMLRTRRELTGMTARTVRAIFAERHRIDRAFRIDPANRERFIAMFRTERGLLHGLRRMNLYGVLGQYLPVAT